MLKAAIIMGSDSDLPTMSEAALVLEKLEVDFEVHVMSAHRTPDAVKSFVSGAYDKGFGVIIAGAGGAAHLAGVAAAHTCLPVIGVPIHSRLDGVDSLLSTVQMPRGVPVACVAVNGAHNAGILAAQMLSLSDPELLKRIAALRLEVEKSALAKDDRIQELGYKKYLEIITNK